MSTGKRLAKRSIIGTRVCAPGDDGKFYSGVIHAVKTPGNSENFNNNSETRYSVRFDSPINCGSKGRSVTMREYKDCELIGPGFQAVSGITMQPGQKVFLTYNGREVTGVVTSHDPQLDEVLVNIIPPGHENPVEVRKRLEEVRLLESRKSARLMDQDTDFARLADMAGDRKRPSSHSIDVPTVHGSRKRRPSSSHEDCKELDFMDECTAALVLMSLSCSPHSPNINGLSWPDRRLSPSPSSDVCSWRSATPSPPLSEGGGSTTAFWAQLATDEGIGMDDYDELPRKKKAGRVVFQCTWPGCQVVTTTCSTIESHVRKAHLGPRDGDLEDREEEFYYTEVSLGPQTSSPPTLSHQDMARPPHEDPEYQKQFKQSQSRAGPINIPNRSLGWGSAATSPKHLKLSPRSLSSQGSALSLSAPNKLLGSPTRKLRGDTKKCRKVYGMEHRDMWCTQCKWKKACTRFGD
ncbi:zinc finger protein 395 isoform X2 [Anabrus simplex]|uniref:zinc finger protein 395 isoform X2 n=1 Tax=Anabrus simplex TaxID=316456 RepID=UPI0034DCE7D8